MVEVVPEVQYFGNHFLASDDPEDEESGGGRGGQGGGASEMAEQSMARHNELTRQMQENGFHNPGLESNGMMDESVESGEGKAGYGCRLCGKISGNGASLFAHLLYPHYAHLWKTEIPHRIPRYDCNKCNYTTGKRQHYVMHVARVHDELRTKLAALGENLEVLDNLTQKHNTGNEIIVSTIAKGLNNTDDGGNDSISIKEEPTTSDSPVASKDTTYSADDLEYSTSQKAAMAAAMLSQYNGADLPGRFPRGFKPFVKCRLCGKSWKGKDNFFTHLVSTHFKYLWAKEVPRHAEMFICHVAECTYKSKYRYNFLFHLAGKHKQLKSKLVEEGVPLNVLKPIETDGSEFEQQQHLQQQQQQQNHNGGSSAGGSSGRGGGRNHRQSSSTAEDSYAQLAQLAAGGGLMETAEMLRQSKILMQAKQRLMTTPGSAVKGSDNGSEPATGPRGGKPSKPGTNNTRLICRVCNKVSLNHTCHRQHVVGKHFIEFWAHLTPDHMGVFNCHHPECPYKTPNRSVFIIHLAYVHQELKTKLIQSGKDPNCATPDVYGKRKYRRALYDNSIHSAPGSPALGMGAAAITIQEQLAAYLQAGAVAAAQAAAQAASMNESGSSPEPIPAPAVQEPRPQIQCRICKEAFPSMSSVTDHLAQTHFSHIWEDSTLGAYHMPRVSGQGYSCQHCPRTAPSRTSFIRHIVKQHDAMTQVLAVQFDNQKTIQDLVQLVNPEDLASAVSTAASGSSAGGPAPINSNGGGSLDDHEQDDDDVEMVQEEEEEDLEDEEDIGEDNVAVANHESW